ncbi:MAG: hypothetical protein ACXW11_10795 [Methylotenera sp.]
MTSIILQVVTDFLYHGKLNGRRKMSHVSDPKSKNQQAMYDRGPHTDRRERMFASLAYNHAKQRGFLTGGDVLKSLEAETEVNDSLNTAAT